MKSRNASEYCNMFAFEGDIVSMVCYPIEIDWPFLDTDFNKMF